MLAILGATSAIDPVYKDGVEVIGRGTVAAGYQNFFICVEMFFAAIALRFAFGVGTYSDSGTTGMCLIAELLLYNLCVFQERLVSMVAV